MTSILADRRQWHGVPSPGVVSAGFVYDDEAKDVSVWSPGLVQYDVRGAFNCCMPGPPSLQQQSLSDIIRNGRITVASVGKIIQNESKDMRRKLRSIEQLRLKRRRRRRRKGAPEWISLDVQTSWDQYQAILYNRARNVKQLATLLREYETTHKQLVREITAASSVARLSSSNVPLSKSTLKW